MFADHVSDVNSSNDDVSNNCVRPIVDATINGINSTVIVYRQTAARKKFTMIGNSEELV